MKLKVEDSVQWRPMNISLSIESVEEARLLFHVFNRCNLLDVLIGEMDEYDFSAYSPHVAKEFKFSNGGSSSTIRKVIEDQGFEV